MLVKAPASIFVFIGCLSMHTAADVDDSLVGLKTVFVATVVDGDVAPHNNEVMASRLRTIVKLRLQKEGFKLVDALKADAVVEVNVTVIETTKRRRSHLLWVSFTTLRVTQACRLIRNGSIVIGETWHKSTVTITHGGWTKGLPSELEEVTREHLDKFVNEFNASERNAKSNAKGKAKTD